MIFLFILLSRNSYCVYYPIKIYNQWEYFS